MTPKIPLRKRKDERDKLDDNLILWLRFEESAGSIAYDSSRSFNHGTITDATYITGKVNAKALSFNGTSAYVSGTNTGISSAPLTVTAWVYYKGINRSIFHERGNGIDSAAGGFNFALGTEGKLVFTTYSVKDYGLSNTALTQNTWQFVAMVLDSSFDVTYYLNGEADGTSTHNVNMQGSAADWLVAAFRVSATYPTISSFTLIDIDEIRVYNRELSAAEILNLYRASGGT